MLRLSNGGHCQLKEVWRDLEYDHLIMLWALHMSVSCCSFVADRAYGHTKFYSKTYVFPVLSKRCAHSQMRLCFNFVHTSTSWDWKMAVSSVKLSGLLCCSASPFFLVLPTAEEESGCELGWIAVTDWNDLARFAGQGNRTVPYRVEIHVVM